MWLFKKKVLHEDFIKLKTVQFIMKGYNLSYSVISSKDKIYLYYKKEFHILN